MHRDRNKDGERDRDPTKWLARKREAERIRDPKNLLRVSGNAATVILNSGVTSSQSSAALGYSSTAYSAAHSSNASHSIHSQNSGNLIAWQAEGMGVTLIDRFDVRNQLHFINPLDCKDHDDIDVPLPPTNADVTDADAAADSDSESAHDFNSDDDEIKFQSYRDLIQLRLEGADESRSIEFIDEHWNTLFLDKNDHANLVLNAASNSANTATTASSEPVGSVFKNLTTDQSILHVVSDLTQEDTNLLDATGRKFGIQSASSLYKDELKQIIKPQSAPNDKSRSSKFPRQRRKRPFKKKDNATAADDASSTSSSSSDEPESSFVIEFESGDEKQAAEMQPTQPVPPIAQLPANKKLGSLSKTIMDSELRSFGDDPLDSNVRSANAAATLHLEDTVKAGNEERRGDCDRSTRIFDMHARINSNSANDTKKAELNTPSNPDLQKLSASEKLKMKAKLALNKQIVNDEKTQILFKKRRPNSSASNVRQSGKTSVGQYNQERIEGVALVDEFGRTIRRAADPLPQPPPRSDKGRDSNVADNPKMQSISPESAAAANDPTQPSANTANTVSGTAISDSKSRENVDSFPPFEKKSDRQETIGAATGSQSLGRGLHHLLSENTPQIKSVTRKGLIPKHGKTRRTADIPHSHSHLSSKEGIMVYALPLDQDLVSAKRKVPDLSLVITEGLLLGPDLVIASFLLPLGQGPEKEGSQLTPGRAQDLGSKTGNTMHLGKGGTGLDHNHHFQNGGETAFYCAPFNTLRNNT
ncbi:hypothetical protein HDU80_000190 [Chytriomyces hyalinus]|nr:hypothetical protein HDU80_000190 [Chytriomyces hyalinus]